MQEFSTLDGYDGWYGSTLRKLPLWGKNDDYSVNFEYPTEEEWSLMDHNVSITSIDFSSKDEDNYLLASVKLTYSDGVTKLFENINPSSGEAWKTWNH